MHSINKSSHQLRTLARLVPMVALVLPPLATADDGQRRVGDMLSYALPVATLGAEVWRGDREGSLQFAGSFVVTLAATEVLKRGTHVERPDHTNNGSFPSGHAARAFASAAYVHRRHGLDSAWPLYALAGYVGYTRVHAHRHRWGDLAGAAVVAAASSWWLVEPLGPNTTLEVSPGRVSISWSVPLR